MLIIVNITTNRLTASTTSKTCYMLDFNEVFWHADNADKTRICGKNTRITRKNTRITRKITRITADSEIFFADAFPHQMVQHSPVLLGRKERQSNPQNEIITRTLTEITHISLATLSRCGPIIDTTIEGPPIVHNIVHRVSKVYRKNPNHTPIRCEHCHSCAQSTALGHNAQHHSPPIRERLSSNTERMVNKSPRE